MLCEDQIINRYGAKFFIGQLVRIVSIHGDTEDEDVNKLGIVDGIVGSIEDGFRYSLGRGESNMKAWFDEDDLDFVVTEERKEWEDNGKYILSVIKDQLKWVRRLGILVPIIL